MENTRYTQVALHFKPFWVLRGVIWIAFILLLITSTISVFGASPAGVISPTATPTATTNSASAQPSRTPSSRSGTFVQSVPGQPQVDQYTIALYHFDSPNTFAIDATGRYTGTLHGNATITDTGLYAGVLLLDGNNSYVRTGYLGNLSEGTVEAFVDYLPACTNGSYRSIISAVDESTGETVFAFGNNVLQFQIYANGQTYFADSGINPCRYLAGQSGDRWPYETWRFHHVAATWGPRGMEIWVDGVLHGVGNNDPAWNIEPYKYMCNPQMQMGGYGYPPNELYPRCKTPVMAPTMPAYPPGDYTGGLPPYTTFRIGCDTTGCINSRIDEVRISNVQRTFQWTVVPTVTPIPTQTPVPITGEYSVDSNTLALLHFTSPNLALDEVTHQNKQLRGQASVASDGRYGTGLNLDGNGSMIDLGPLSNPFGATVEAWVKLRSAQAGLMPIYSVGVCETCGNTILFLGSYDINSFVFQVSNSEGTVETKTTIPRSGFVDCWRHVAGTWGPRGAELWIDGILQATNTTYTGRLPEPIHTYRVGCDYRGNCFNGVIDEVRVSQVQRTFTRSTTPRGRLPVFGDNFLYLPFIFVAPTPSSSCAN